MEELLRSVCCGGAAAEELLWSSYCEGAAAVQLLWSVCCGIAAEFFFILIILFLIISFIRIGTGS